MPAPYTRLSTIATPGRNYNSFENKVGILEVLITSTPTISIITNIRSIYGNDKKCNLASEYNRLINVVQGYFQKSCKLYYPPIWETCANCSWQFANKISTRFISRGIDI